jgi:hypothetical protein
MSHLTILLLGAVGLGLVLYVVVSEWRAHRHYAAYLRDIEARAARLEAQRKGER